MKVAEYSLCTSITLYTPFQIHNFRVSAKSMGWYRQFPYEQIDGISHSKLLGQASPLIKAPIELASGEYSYTGIPINDNYSYIGSLFSPGNTVAIAEKKDSEAEKWIHIASRLGLGMPAGALEKSTLPSDKKK